MTAYTFCIDSLIRGMFEATMNTNLYEIILWQMETYFVSEKREIHTVHSYGYQEVINGTLDASYSAHA